MLLYSNKSASVKCIILNYLILQKVSPFGEVEFWGVGGVEMNFVLVKTGVLLCPLVGYEMKRNVDSRLCLD